MKKTRQTFTRIFTGIALSCCLAAGCYAQSAGARPIPEDASGEVTNEDQGKAFVITSRTQPMITSVRRRIGPAPRQYSVFLGSNWSSDSLRQLEPTLANLLANSPNASALDDLGMKNVYAVNDYTENLMDLGNRSLSDLAIQGILDTMFKENAMPVPSSPTVFVVYIQPSAQSGFAGMSPGKHYLAYLNSFNSSGQEIRYIVVPMDTNGPDAYQTGLSAFLSAIFS